MKKLLSVFLILTALVAQDEFSLSKATIGGYGELHINSVSEKGKATKTTADFHRFVLFFGYNFSDSWSFKSEVELEHNMVGAKYKGELELEQAYVDYHHSDEFGFRAGVILAPVGYINEIHEPPTFFGVERPTFDKYILPTTWFDNGASIYGTINKEIAYNVSIMGGLDGDGIFKSGIRSGRAKGESKALAGYNFNNPTFIARADYLGIEGANVGASFTLSNARRTDKPSLKTSILDLHAKYTKDNIFFKGQFASVNYDKDVVGYDAHVGRLVEAGYDVMEGSKTFAPFVRYEDLSMQSGHATDEKAANATILTLGVSYKPLDKVVFKADYSTFETKESGSEAKNTIAVCVGYMF